MSAIDDAKRQIQRSSEAVAEALVALSSAGRSVKDAKTEFSGAAEGSSHAMIKQVRDAYDVASAACERAAEKLTVGRDCAERFSEELG